MFSLKKISISTFLMLMVSVVFARQLPVTKESFSMINLSYPGLEKVNKLVRAGDYESAAAELLHYYRIRTNVKLTEYNREDKSKYVGKPIAKDAREKADNALLHQFQPHKGYGFFDYGKDINWQYWPVKDNEVRWQLHRMYWWQPMGLAYWSTGDEQYAREWTYQFSDWVIKNPLGLSKDNDQYAWRPLEVSERLQSLPGTFNMFINSANFTPQFLLEFLKSYNQQAGYIPSHYSELGNHLLFEAQRLITAGCFFPELKDAEEWRKSGVAVLNREIKKQVYADGMQFELSPTYHNAAIDIFLRALRTAQLAGVANVFPAEYRKTVESMILATINFSFPDYTYPMFGDSWMIEKKAMLKQYQSWAEAFPENNVIRYFASDHKDGSKPAYLSHALPIGGFYSFRNSWETDATTLVLKASPPGEFHAQPDNGTFELWVRGRNFTPDAGVYVYSGDAEINKLREAYRQTKVHQTLTLNDENMVITKADERRWETSPNLDILSYANPSYKDLNHTRSVLFIDKKYFVIIDQATGTASGKLGIHFQLREDSKPVFDKQLNAVHTSYADGNNLLIQSFSGVLKEEPGKVSYQYRKETDRPAFVFEKEKDKPSASFVSVLYPYEGGKAPAISITENAGNDIPGGQLNITLMIDGTKKVIETRLNK